MKEALNRRAVIKLMANGAALTALPILGCEDEPSSTLSDSALAGRAGAPTGGEAGGVEAGAEEPVSQEWATGGTASMVAIASYPNPFTEEPMSCALVATTTAGPCTTESVLLREDISEGWTGLPVRLALKIVDERCEPLTEARVEVWHTNIEGSYSGETPQARCRFEDEYEELNFFRGAQDCDQSGEVYFNTCFPGWYPGRAIHLHFQVTKGDQSYRISQLFFPEELTTELFERHSEYMPYGQPDTSSSRDGVIGRIAMEERAALTLDVQQMPDGALLAYKVIRVV